MAGPDVSAAQVVGVVADDADGTPVHGALIVVSDEAGTEVLRTTTGPTGTFDLQPLPAGRYQLGVHALGYRSLVGVHVVAGSEPTLLELRLAPDPLSLDPLTVTGEMTRRRLETVGFYRRESIGIGRFLRTEEIEARTTDRISDALRMEPSVRLTPLRDGTSGYQVTFHGPSLNYGPCSPALVLDGMKVGGNIGLDDLVHPANVLALELYPRGHGVPVQWSGTDAGCGVIVVWTKRREP